MHQPLEERGFSEGRVDGDSLRLQSCSRQQHVAPSPNDVVGIQGLHPPVRPFRKPRHRDKKSRESFGNFDCRLAFSARFPRGSAQTIMESIRAAGSNQSPSPGRGAWQPFGPTMSVAILKEEATKRLLAAGSMHVKKSVCINTGAPWWCQCKTAAGNRRKRMGFAQAASKTRCIKPGCFQEARQYNE